MSRKEILNLLENCTNLKELVLDYCFNYKDLCKHLNLSGTRSQYEIIAEYLTTLGISILYPKISKRDSRLILRYVNDINNWWEHSILKDVILNRLKDNLVVNFADKAKTQKRYVVAFPGHPRSSSANQVKAHILLWEYHNKQLFLDNYVLVPKDGNFCNLDINNFKCYTNEEYRSITASGTRNHFYKAGTTVGVCYKGGWKTITKNFLINNKCTMCGEKELHKLCTHHIISYYLFDKPKNAHFTDNLLCLCSTCHAKVHANNLSLSGYVSETRRLNLLELLESLKSKYINTDFQVLLDFSIKSISSQTSKQLEEGSTTISKESTLQANGNGSGELLTGKAEDEDIVSTSIVI